MAVTVTKPDKHAKCICCGSSKFGVHEFQFQSSKNTGIKSCITLCKPCVYRMADMMTQDTVNKLEGRDVH